MAQSSQSVEPPQNPGRFSVDSVNAPQSARLQAWSRLARDLDLQKLARTTQVVGLADVPEVARRVLAGKVQGRTIVDVNA